MRARVALATALSFLQLTCKDQGVEPRKEEEQRGWVLVSQFSTIDVRYTIEHNGKLYLAGVDISKQSGQPGYGNVFATTDGVSWTTLKTFRRATGPMIFRGDTLYMLSDSLFKGTPDGTWTYVCKPEPLTQDPSGMGDMIFLRDTLYAMYSLNDAVVSTYRIGFDGVVTQLYPRFGRSYGGSKFIQSVKNGNPAVYVRGHYYVQGFYEFDGRTFAPIQEGLSQIEFGYPPTNSMAIRNDTLFAGFHYPASIKFLKNDRWFALTDTMPYSRMYNHFKVKTEPTAIAFASGRIFVATSPLGVLEWKESGWQRMSDGLPTLPIEGIDDMYNPVVHLVFFRNKLFAGFGEPGYAPWGGTGLYVLPIEG